jgi:hypothetical protein
MNKLTHFVLGKEYGGQGNGGSKDGVRGAEQSSQNLLGK